MIIPYYLANDIVKLWSRSRFQGLGASSKICFSQLADVFRTLIMMSSGTLNPHACEADGFSTFSSDSGTEPWEIVVYSAPYPISWLL